MPTGAQFLNESRDWLQKRKGRILQIVQPQNVQAAPLALEHFALEVEIMGQRAVMDYYVARQAVGGVTLAGLVCRSGVWERTTRAAERRTA